MEKKLANLVLSRCHGKTNSIPVGSVPYPLVLMHQSIPAVPITPGNRGGFAHIVSSRVGAIAILSWPWELGITM